MLLKPLAVVVLAALTLGCADDRPRLRLVTEGSSFERQMVPSTSVSPVAYVPFSVTNDGHRTAFLPTCGSRVTPVVEQMVNGRWESYVGGYCMLSFPMVPLELDAGKSHRDLVAVATAGHFRLRMPYSSDAEMSKNFDAVSWQFDVR